MKLNKKGTFWISEFAYLIFSGILLLFGMIIIVTFLFSTLSAADAQDEEVKLHIDSARIINSPDCFAWEETIGDQRIVHAGILDFDKMTSSFDSIQIWTGTSRLQKCFYDRTFSVRVDFIYGEDLFDMTFANAPAKDLSRIERFYVLVNKDEALHPAMLEVRLK